MDDFPPAGCSIPCSVLSCGKGCYKSLAVGMELLPASCVQEQISREDGWGAAAPKAREDGDTGTGSTGRLKSKKWHFWVDFPLCYQVSPCNRRDILFPA